MLGARRWGRRGPFNGGRLPVWEDEKVLAVAVAVMTQCAHFVQMLVGSGQVSPETAMSDTCSLLSSWSVRGARCPTAVCPQARGAHDTVQHVLTDTGILPL